MMFRHPLVCRWVRIFGHTVGWQLGQTRTMLQWTALSHLRSPDSQSMPQGYQLPEALASKPPVKLIGLIQLCRQHCADAGGIAHAQFDSELGGQIQLAKDDIEATCFKSNQHVHRLLGVLADMLSGKVCRLPCYAANPCRSLCMSSRLQSGRILACFAHRDEAFPRFTSD